MTNELSLIVNKSVNYVHIYSKLPLVRVL